jgi:hypothetical protein
MIKTTARVLITFGRIPTISCDLLGGRVLITYGATHERAAARRPSMPRLWRQLRKQLDEPVLHKLHRDRPTGAGTASPELAALASSVKMTRVCVRQSAYWRSEALCHVRVG